MYKYNFPVKNDFIALRDIGGLDIELTAARSRIKRSDGTRAEHPAELAISVLEKVLAEVGSQLDYVGLTANHGDPSLYSALVDAIDLIQEQKVKSISVSTHGSSENTLCWEGLGRRLGQGNGKVIFSIDGLEDTLPYSNPSLDWDLIVSNARLFIGAGGNAIWNWRPYQHTDHQVNQAKELAEKMGFAAFVVNKSPRHAPIKNEDGYELKHSKLYFHTHLERHEEAKKAGKTATRFPVSCRSKKRKTLYMDYTGLILPCSFFVKGDRANNIQQIIDSYGRERFEVQKHSLKEILGNPWYSRDMLYSIKTLPTCRINCELFSKVSQRENQIVYKFKEFNDLEPWEGIDQWDLPFEDSPEPWEVENVAAYVQEFGAEQ